MYLINSLMIVLYRWLAPLLLLLDLYEKVSVISKRKAEASKLLVSYCETHLTDKFDCYSMCMDTVNVVKLWETGIWNHNLA